MTNPIKSSFTKWIFIATVAFMIFFALAIVYVYDLTLNDAKKSHQLQQIEMAKSMATGIDFYLKHLLEDMHLLSIYYGELDRIGEAFWPEVNMVYNHYEQRVVKSIFFTDEDAKIIYYNGDRLPESIRSLILEQSKTAVSAEKQIDFWYSPVLPLQSDQSDSGLFFIMIRPLLGIDKGIFTGFIGYVISFDQLITQYIRPLELSEEDFAWIMDGTGRLIFHPAHKEMLLRSIHDPSPDCRSCHPSFDIQKNMLNKKSSIGEYTISDEPAKLMAYDSVNLMNERWIVVISTLITKVTASLRHNFQLFFILGFVILGVVTFFGLSLYFVNSKRIRAEEASRQYEQMQQLQLQLNHTSKLASIGELVDTVAHEINTPAGIIAAQAESMIWQKDNSKMYAEEIQMIKEQTRRISKYTKSLLNYSKRVHFNPKPIDVNQLLDDCLYLLGHRFRVLQVDIVKNYNNYLPKVLLDRGQIEQVFINLLNNACDAINNQGKIEIVTHSIIQKNRILEDRVIENIEISITDDGKGIPASSKDKIFDPFFSTKSPSEGTGLGLYISKSIINRHHGKITSSSVAGKGATFKILLPLNFKRIEEV
jgi:signal transduction histidine kinase